MLSTFDLSKLMVMTRLQHLDSPYELTQEQIAFFDKNRYIKLKDVFDAETLSHFNKVITDQVNEMNNVDTPLEQRSTYGKAFLQLFNLWRENDDIKSLLPT